MDGVRDDGIFGSYILTGKQFGGAPEYKCDSGLKFMVYKYNDGTWRGDIPRSGGEGYIR